MTEKIKCVDCDGDGRIVERAGGMNICPSCAGRGYFDPPSPAAAGAAIADYDYSADAPAPTEDLFKRLSRVAAGQAMLEMDIERLEAELRSKKQELEQYKTKLVPEVLDEMGLSSVKTRGGLQVDVSDVVHASFPKDVDRREAAFSYLRAVGNDGIVKREIKITLGRDSTDDAARVMRMLQDAGLVDRGLVSSDDTIHHSTLTAFLRAELREGREVPLEAFGAFVRREAKVRAG